MINTPIILNGKEYFLRYDLNALVYIEDNLGYSITQMDPRTAGAKAILVGIYAGLLWDPRKCPARSDIGKWISDLESLNYATDKFAEAIESSYGEKKEQDPNVSTDQ